MRKKCIKTLCLLITSLLIGCPNIVFAEETTNSQKESNSIQQQYEFEIISNDIDNNRSLAKITTHTVNGEINNNGVRLRSAPSTSATILELMYDGELVWIDWDAYGTGGLNWHRVQRIKTGTYGWVSKEYVYSWD